MREENKPHCLNELAKSIRTLHKTFKFLASNGKVFFLVDMVNEGFLGLAFAVLALKKLHVVSILLTYPQNTNSIVNILKNVGLRISKDLSNEDLCLRIVPLKSRKTESEILKIIAKFGIHNTIYLGSKNSGNTFLSEFRKVLDKSTNVLSIFKSNECSIKQSLVKHPYPDMVLYAIFNSVLKDNSHECKVLIEKILATYEKSAEEKELKQFNSFKHLIKALSNRGEVCR